MTNGSRFTTEEIVERDDLLMTADSKIKQLEYTLFQNLRDKCRIESVRLANMLEKLRQSMSSNALQLLHEKEIGINQRWSMILQSA